MMSAKNDAKASHAANTVGGHLASRVAQAGVRDFFTVPGDFNLVLLDQFLTQPGLRMVGCCNELNAGYAADGYARATGGLAVVVVTYMVGGLSVINAAAGAYAEDLPLLVVSGGPNSLDQQANHRVHHTLGEADLYQCAKCYEPVAAETFIVRHVEDAAAMIDRAVTVCLSQRKPVYLEIACNLAGLPLPEPPPLTLPPPRCAADPASLEAAVTALADRLESAVKPVLIAGVHLRSQIAATAFHKLADVLGCAVAVLPDAKGLFPETHPGFIGTYWGAVSSPDCVEVVESSDCQLFAGPKFTDYSTVGWTTLTPSSKLIHAGPDFLRMQETEWIGLRLDSLLEELARRVNKKEASLTGYRRLHTEESAPAAAPAGKALSLKEFRRQVQLLLAPDMDLVLETGDSWFNGQKLHLPEGTGFHIQMQYGSIGWATGATLGVSVGAGAKRRTVSLIGDGSFQLTAQEVSTMIRHQANPIIFLLNNRGYTIEVEIHDGPYNNIQNWDYAGLVKVFNAGQGNGLGMRATTAGELAAAIEQAQAHKGLVLIECALDRDDCTAELLEWGSRVAAANART